MGRHHHHLHSALTLFDKSVDPGRRWRKSRPAQKHRSRSSLWSQTETSCRQGRLREKRPKALSSQETLRGEQMTRNKRAFPAAGAQTDSALGRSCVDATSPAQGPLSFRLSHSLTPLMRWTMTQLFFHLVLFLRTPSHLFIHADDILQKSPEKSHLEKYPQEHEMSHSVPEMSKELSSKFKWQNSVFKRIVSYHKRPETFGSLWNTGIKYLFEYYMYIFPSL